MAALGLVNTGLIVWWFFKYLTTYTGSEFWWTWFFVVAVNGILWMPLFFSWPVLFFAGTTSINTVTFFA